MCSAASCANTVTGGGQEEETAAVAARAEQEKQAFAEAAERHAVELIASGGRAGDSENYQLRWR